MLKFVARERASPAKKEPAARRASFNEIYSPFEDAKAKEQASRCSQCGVPFCQSHCPLGNNIPDWLRLAAEGRLKEAYEISSQTNNMPEVCGRICPQDRLCEGACVIEQSGHGTVTIGAVEQFITETAWANGWVAPVRPKNERAQSVGIIGAGPAGLAAAEELRRAGVQVVIYDRYDRPGGLLIYGIPNFKLEKHVVIRRTERLRESGVHFELNTDIGRDVSFDEVRGRHDAVLIAVGVYAARNLEAPGADGESVVPALPYLTASNRRSFNDRLPDADNRLMNASGKRVVVIGGGDTAMDCVRTAVRQGAKSVTCLYRRDRENMPGSAREVLNAEEEGVRFEWLAAPRAVLGSVDAISGVRAHRMRLGAVDEWGRRRPEAIDGSDFDIDCDLVIKALGFEPETDAPMLADVRLKKNSRGALRVDPRSYETTMDGVYAAGDIIRGASLVVWAIADGRGAAAEIIDRLSADALGGSAAA